MLAGFRLNSLCNWNSLPANGQPHYASVLSELKVEKAASENRFPINLVVVVDGGQILNGEILRAVKKALKNVG